MSRLLNTNNQSSNDSEYVRTISKRLNILLSYLRCFSFLRLTYQ